VHVGIIGKEKSSITPPLEGKMYRSLRAVFYLTLVFLILVAPIYAQKYSKKYQGKSLYEVPVRNLVYAPTAGTLPRGCFDIILRAYPGGGILVATGIGLSNRLLVGMSYGGEGIVSEVEPIWNPRIEFDVKFRIIDEEYYLPAFTVGYISQGYGAYSDSLERYTYKSKGFYGVVSRSFHFYQSSIGGHLGMNYSLEYKKDKDDEPSIFFGFDTRFNDKVSFVMDYDLAFNDDKTTTDFGKGKGYLNVGVKWLFSESLELEAIFDNLLNNRASVNTFGRGLRFTYLEFF